MHRCRRRCRRRRQAHHRCRRRPQALPFSYKLEPGAYTISANINLQTSQGAPWACFVGAGAGAVTLTAAGSLTSGFFVRDGRLGLADLTLVAAQGDQAVWVEGTAGVVAAERVTFAGGSSATRTTRAAYATAGGRLAVSESVFIGHDVTGSVIPYGGAVHAAMGFGSSRPSVAFNQVRRPAWCGWAGLGAPRGPFPDGPTRLPSCARARRRAAAARTRTGHVPRQPRGVRVGAAAAAGGRRVHRHHSD